MNAWRWPTRREQKQDFAYLSAFLDPQVAYAIAGMPVLVIKHPVPFKVAADAWCFRVDRLLGPDR